ncbi:hypothetical protein ACF0H5_020276 [Mactra antiquata]
MRPNCCKYRTSARFWYSITVFFTVLVIVMIVSSLIPSKPVKKVKVERKRVVYNDAYCRGVTPPPRKEIKSERGMKVRGHKHINMYNITEGALKIEQWPRQRMCVPYKTTEGITPIFIYDPNSDIHISYNLHEHGHWEGEDVLTVAVLIKQDPNMVFLDLGCNIGIYTIQVAKIGRKVLAVDANAENLRLLSKSLTYGGIEDNVTLLLNAISDVHETIQLNKDYINIGGYFASSARDSHTLNKGVVPHTVSAITLEDLVPIITGPPVFIKIDIEGFEWRAFRGGEIFLKEVNIKYILMEWLSFTDEKFAGEKANALDVIAILKKFEFSPFEVNKELDKPLNYENYKKWPTNILLVRK